MYDGGGFGFGFGYGYGGGRRINPLPSASARIAAAEAASKAAASGQPTPGKVRLLDEGQAQAQAQAMVQAEKTKLGAAGRIAAALALAKAAREEQKAAKPKETDFFRSFLNTTREEHRERLAEVATSMREANLSRRASSARSAAAEGEEKDQKRKESITKTYCDFLLNKRNQSARERIKDMKKYGFAMEGREQHSLLDDMRVDRREEGDRRYTFPLARGQSIREPSFLKDASISFEESKHGSRRGTGDLGALVAQGKVDWPGAKAKYNLQQMDDWDMSLHDGSIHDTSLPETSAEKSFATREPSFLQQRSPETSLDQSFVTREPSFLKIDPPDRRTERSNALSRFLNEEGPEIDFPPHDREELAAELERRKKDEQMGIKRAQKVDHDLMQPSHLEALSRLTGYQGEAIAKGELSQILKEGKSEWEKPADAKKDHEKSFNDVLGEMKDDPEKGKEYLLNDNYFPGVIDDAVNRKLDFNKLAFTLTYFNEKIPEETPPADKQPMSLVEAFDKRFEIHRESLKKTTRDSGGDGRGGESMEAASATTMDRSEMPAEVSRSRMLSFLPSRVSKTKILNREETVLASTIPIDVTTIVQNRPMNELIQAMNNLQKAEFMNDYDKSAQAAEEAFKRAPPELAESAAIFGARNFRRVESTKKHATVKRDQPYRPIEVVSYMGITKPMPDVRV